MYRVTALMPAQRERRELLSAAAGTARVLPVLGLRPLGTLGCQEQHHPAAQNFPLFLSLLSRFLKQKFSLSEVFRGRWRESRKPKRIVLLVKAFNNYF